MSDEDYDMVYDVVFNAVSDFLRCRGEAIETACEAALQGGIYGVRVIDRPYGSTVKVDPSVPYGRIYVQVEQ